jgi:multisubunit Na+/H+ antiporter MnhC subunit
MQTLIEITVGILLAIGFVLLVRRGGSYAKEKQAFAIGLIATALIYVVFGFLSGSVGWIFTELIGVPIYAIFALLGLRKSGWFLAVGWALHPVWDAGLHDFSTPFVPHWYIGGCLGFDLLVAAYIGFRKIKK